MIYCDQVEENTNKEKFRKISKVFMNNLVNNLVFGVLEVVILELDKARGISILGEVRNVAISRPTQQLLWYTCHDFLAIFALFSALKNQSNCIIL